MRYSIIRKEDGDKDYSPTGETYDDEMVYPLNATDEQKAYVDRLSAIAAQDYMKLFEGNVALVDEKGRTIEISKGVKMDKATIKAVSETPDGMVSEDDAAKEKKAAKKSKSKSSARGKADKKRAADAGSTNAARTAAQVEGAAEPAPEVHTAMGPRYNPTGTGPNRPRYGPGK